MSTGWTPFFLVVLTRLRAVPGRCVGIALAQGYPKMICLERVLNSERNRSDGLTAQTLKLQLFDFFFSLFIYFFSGGHHLSKRKKVKIILKNQWPKVLLSSETMNYL